jgi:hypothetical protein
MAAIQPALPSSCSPQKYRISAAVELGAEPRRALEHARDPPVDAVEQRGEDDRGDSPFEFVLDREPDRRQSGAQRQQRDQVRHQRTHRDEPETPAPGIDAVGIERRVWHAVSIADGARRHQPRLCAPHP